MTYRVIYRVYQNKIHNLKKTPLHNLDQAIDRVNLITFLTSRTYKMMRDLLNQNKFNSTEDEIHFFKFVLPDIISELKLCKCIKKHVYKLKNTNEEFALSFIKNQIRKKKKCLDKFILLIEYYDEGNTINDKVWFTVSHLQLNHSSVSWTCILNDNYSTNMSVKVAKMRFCQKIIDFYQRKIKIKSALIFENTKQLNNQSQLKWTGTKSEFTELVYALSKSNVIDHGQAKLSDISNHLSSVFETASDVNIYSVFDEIKKRKKEPTKFLNEMQKSLNDEINK